MQFADPSFLVPSLAGLLSLLMMVIILRTRSLREPRTALLQGFLLTSLAWSVTQALLQLTQLGMADGFDSFALERIGLYLMVALVVIFYHLTRMVDRYEKPSLSGWLIGAVFLVAGVILYENLLRLPNLFDGPGGFVVVRYLLAFTILVIGWVVFSFAALITTVIAYRRVTSPLHKNRWKYWALVVGLFVPGQTLLITRVLLAGVILQGLAVILAGFVLLTYNLPDLRLAARKTGIYLVTVFASILIYTAVFYFTLPLLQRIPGANPLLVGLVIAIVLAIVLNPLVGGIERFINRLLSGDQYDANHTLSEYSQHISNILDMEVLAPLVLGMLGEVMQVSHGALITASYQADETAGDASSGTYLFRPVDDQGRPMPEVKLAARSPLAYHLRRERQPLTQYDIDLLPRFQGMRSDERAWLSSLNMDVYLPIYAKDVWIGLIALGPKISGDRYFDHDLTLLKTLADQTAVALENARLYQGLKERNADNEHLNRELRTANQELARLDQAKSDFINIASHELRTPLTQVIGYNDILGDMLRDPNFKTETGARMVSSVRKAARRLEEIVETMFDVSKLDTHTLDLMRAPVSLAAVISTAIETWQDGLRERSQNLSVRGLANLPSIMADSGRLSKVFSHLVQNAIKSTPDGGQIRVAGQVIADENSQQSFIEITVTDSGIGIAPEDLERIFNKFYRVGNVQLHSSGDTKFKGAGPGLGLTIARGIVEAHGGRIWAESSGYDEETCPGACFHVLLPVGRAENAGEMLVNGSRTRVTIAQ